MGAQDVNRGRDAAELRFFITRLLHDIQALEAMLADGMIESGVRRIGAEQELFLVDQAWRPAPVAMEVLDAIGDPHYTTELARFNLEINLDPLAFAGDCLLVVKEGHLVGIVTERDILNIAARLLEHAQAART